MRNIFILSAIYVLGILMIGCSANTPTPQAAPTNTTTPPTATSAPTQMPSPTTAPSTPTIAPTRAPAQASPTSPVNAPTIAPMPVNGITARLNEPFTLGLSQWATLPDANNTRVFFTTILEDTRCALDVNCFQAGNVRVAVTVESGGKLTRFDLSTRPNDYRRIGSFNGYLVQFIDIAPLREHAAVPIQPIEYRLKLMVTRGSLDTTQARLNESFTLKLGQSVSVADLNAQITFESVQQDSRCPARVMCATIGEATVVITLQRDGKTDRLILGTMPANAVKRSALFESAGVYLNAVTPYPQNEFASKEFAPSDYQVTLVVANFVSSAPTGQPTIQTMCSDLSRGDASEILGEAIQEQPTQIILFPPPTTMIAMRGLCGYGSVAYTPNRIAQPDVPYVSPASVRSDRAVIVGKLSNQQRLEQLLSVISVIDAANARGASTLYSKLLTLYSAGTWSRDLLGEFPEAARGATNVRVNKVNALGDSAISVWREFNGGRYAALVAQKGDTLYVVTAIVNSQRSEDATLATERVVIEKMLR
jgi:hypothetical protein